MYKHCLHGEALTQWYRIEDSANISCMWRGLDHVSSKEKRGQGLSWIIFENKQRSWVLSLFSFSLLKNIHLLMSDRHSSIKVILLVNSISLFVEVEIYTIKCHQRKSEIAFHGIVECRPVVLCRVHTESVQGQKREEHCT